MADISKYIYDYLMEHNTSVIVPELGCFTIVNKPAEIRDGTIFPPVKTVEFDSENTTDDHVLTHYIAKKENIIIEKVAEEIRIFYRHFFINKLPLKKSVTFEKFGTFSLNELGNIQFTPDADFFKDNYGLGQTHISGTTFSQPQNVVQPEPVPEVSDDALFDTSDKNRFRENTERRRPAIEKQEKPPVKPNKPVKSTPLFRKRQEQMKTSGTSYQRVLWILIGVVAFGIIGFFGYPMLFPDNTTFNPVVTGDREAKPLHSAESEDNTPNPEVAQTLDDATEKKNALNPDNQQQTTSTSSPSEQTTAPSLSEQTTAPSTPKTEPKQITPSTPKTEPKPTSVAQTQGNVGQGKYVLIIASLSTQAAAKKLMKNLQADGISYEIIDVMVHGTLWHRFSIASFDTLAEAKRQAEEMRSRPHCANVWVAKR